MTSRIAIRTTIIIVYLYLSLAAADLLSYKSISKRCKILDETELKRLCIAKYPREAKNKYFDKYVETGMSYTVFTIGQESGYYLISHGSSGLKGCDGMKFENPRSIRCGEITVLMKKAILRCLPFHTQLSDDLVTHCAGGHNPKSAFTAMHYVDGTTLYQDEKESGVNMNPNLIVLFFCVAVVLQRI